MLRTRHSRAKCKRRLPAYEYLEPRTLLAGDTILFEDFSNAADSLVFNGDAKIKRTGDGTVLRLTPAEASQAGSVFTENTVNVTEFSTAFSFQITGSGGSVFDCNREAGADGIVFVLQSNGSPRNLGGPGHGLGYRGIANSVGVEFDTWCNRDSPDNNDRSANHVDILTGGAVEHARRSSASAVEPNFDNGTPWYGWVDYDGTTLDVRVSESAERPAVPLLSREIDIPREIGSDTAFAGFTSGTGAAWSNHDILEWRYSDELTRTPPATIAPEITVDVPFRTALVGSTVTATGVATAFGKTDDGTMNQILDISVDAIPIEMTDSVGQFSADLTFQPGRNALTFTATDSLGQQATATLTLEGVPLVPGVLQGTLRDFQDSHPDFQAIIGDDPRIVGVTLGEDKKPTYRGERLNPTTHGQAAFEQWYCDVPGVNQTIPFPVQLGSVLTSEGRLYRWRKNEFFPIDGDLFGNQLRDHNFHFTLELHGRFTYRGGESFEFTADDDLWVFINGRREVDLGGVHAPREETIELDEIGLEPGEQYDFDLFFAERHTDGSTLSIETTVVFDALQEPISSNCGSEMQPPTISVTPSATTAAVSEVISANGEALAFGVDAGGDDNQIVSVSVDGKPVDSLDVSTGTFSTQLTLEEGTNAFVFTATDELGQTAETALSLEGIPVIRPDLVATRLRQVPNGVEFSYAVTDQAVDQDATASLFWLGDDFDGGIPTGPAAHQVNFSVTEGDYGPFRLSIPDDLPVLPAGTTQLMLVVDPKNSIHESDEATVDDFGTNNVLVIPFTNSPPEITELSVTPLINEGDSVILQLDFADGDLSDQHTVTIDWGNGTDRSVEVVDVGEQQRSLEREHKYLDDQPSSVVGDDFVISVFVTDQKDVSSRNVVATVNNLPPAVETPVELTVGGDGTVSLSVSFTDVGTLDTHQASIDWGDGTPLFEVPTADIDDGRFIATNEYGPGNTEYTATVRVKDDDGGVGEATTRVLPLAFDILPTSLVIQDEQVSWEWQIRGQDVTVDSLVALYWSDDDEFDPTEDSHVLSIPIEGDDRRIGTYDGFRQVADITTELPPESAEFLIMVVDPENTVVLDDEDNNVLPTKLPAPDIKVLNGNTGNFEFFRLEYGINEFPARPFAFGAYLSTDAFLDEGDSRIEGLAYDATADNWRHLGQRDLPDDETSFDVQGLEIDENLRFVLLVADPDAQILESDDRPDGIGANNVVFAVPMLGEDVKINRFGDIGPQLRETSLDAAGPSRNPLAKGDTTLHPIDVLFERSIVPMTCVQVDCLAHAYAIKQLSQLIDLLNAEQSQLTNPDSITIDVAWTGEDRDSPLHAEGRAIDFQATFANGLDDDKRRFAGLPWLAGFDFVWRTPDDGQTARVHASARHKDLILGDTNFDGVIDFTDFLTFSTNFGLDNRIWSEGDFTGDGRVEFDDFLILASVFGTE